MERIVLEFKDKKSAGYFVKLLEDLAAAAEDGDRQLLQDTMKNAKRNPTGEYALFVSGQKLVEGSLKDMHRRFDQEVGVHSASVEVREMTDKGWVKIRSRMRSQQ
jgi:hypothetical protein